MKTLLALLGVPVLLTGWVTAAAAVFTDEACPATPSAFAVSEPVSAQPVPASSDSGAGVTVSPAPIDVPGEVAGYRGEQLRNAAEIIAAGRELGLDDWTITVAVMTAMGESSLVNIDHGDAAGPDSRGIFQQRANGAWGSYQDRMTPRVAATNFYRALQQVPGYRGMTPTEAAHRTQRNRDPNFYTRWWTPAAQVVAAITGNPDLLSNLNASGGTPSTAADVARCEDGGTGGAGADAGVNLAVGDVDPSCPGGDINGYPNGQIPTQLLCPLVGSAGHRLRADAANAFNKLSAAYAARFGSPICVTDSYRTLSEQIAVRAAKPGLAARPGTSRHGLARAVDLCGGIQSFGTVQHEWMRANAPVHGWCHPTWARAGGSKPEPWHWQYQDCQ